MRTFHPVSKELDLVESRQTPEQPIIELVRRTLATEAVAENARLVLLGDPGSGKSTFLRHLAWALAKHGLDEIDAQTKLFGWPDQLQRLPLFLSLRKLAGRIANEGASIRTVTRTLCDEMTEEYDAYNADITLRQALENGAAILLLDGLDETPTQTVPGQIADRATVLRLVREFCELYARTQAVITCRTRAFSEELRNCLGWPVKTLWPFSLGQMRHFVAEWYGELVERGSLDREQADRQGHALINAIIERERLRDMAGTPLLLTMMALVLYEKANCRVTVHCYMKAFWSNCWVCGTS